MYAKLYITDIPFSLTETKLRSILRGYQTHSVAFIHTVHGNVGVVQVYTLEDAHKVTATLSNLTLKDGKKLSVYPADSIAGQAIEQLLPHIADPLDKEELRNTSERTA